ncbi:MAG: HAD family hydrolase [Armatimonadota bacterium]|nr:HAD family hydrolase [Armatimonadota bacterium]
MREREHRPGPVQGVIFDLWGTLVYRDHGQYEEPNARRLSAWLRQQGLIQDEERVSRLLQEIRREGLRWAEEHHREYTVERAIGELFASLNLPSSDSLLFQAVRIFFAPELQGSRPYPHARETLEALSRMDLRLGLISNATSDWLVHRVLEQGGLDRYLDPIISSAAFGWRKPHLEIFHHVLNTWKILPSQVVMVGDTLDFDLVPARALGMRTILVAVEPDPKNDFSLASFSPDAVVTSLSEIPPLLRQWL